MSHTSRFVLELRGSRRSFTSWTWGPVLCTRWLAKPTLDDIRFAGDIHMRFAHEQAAKDEPLLSWSFIHHLKGVSLDDEGRNAAHQQRIEARDTMLASAIVIDGTGFFPAMARALMTGLSMLQDGRIQESFFRKDEDAAAYLSKALSTTNVPVDDDELLALALQLRETSLPDGDVGGGGDG